MSEPGALPAPLDLGAPEFGDYYDELPLWSAPFGMMLLERVPLAPGMTIVDVGAGTGFLSVELAQRCGPTATVYAVDPWAPAMARLRRKLEYLGLANVRVLEQDAAALDLPPASVDLVVSNLGVNNFENAGAVLTACRRALKPSGRLFLTTNLVGHMREFYDVYHAVLEELDLRDRLPALDEHIAHRATVASTRALLEGAGYAVRDTVTGAFRMRFANGTALLTHRFIGFGFLPGWRAIVAPADEARVLARLTARLNAVAAAAGELALTIPMALVEAAPAAPRGGAA
jgi:arsenite methyltransferase